MASQDLPWYVLYTKPRNEKKVAQRLSEAGYTVYCPLQKVRRQWSDRTKVVEEPLFKSYLFIQIEDHRRDEVFTFPGTVRYLFWLRRPAQVRQVEINTIQKWLGEYNHEDIDISDIQPGRSCTHHLWPILWRRSRLARPYPPQSRRTAQRTGHSTLVIAVQQRPSRTLKKSKSRQSE